MATRRQTVATLTKLRDHIVQFGVKAPISYEEYIKLKPTNPITKRELGRVFNGRWARVLTALIRKFPTVYDDAAKAHAKPVIQPKAEPKVEPEAAPKSAPRKPVTKPAPKRFAAKKEDVKNDE